MSVVKDVIVGFWIPGLIGILVDDAWFVQVHVYTVDSERSESGGKDFEGQLQVRVRIYSRL